MDSKNRAVGLKAIALKEVSSCHVMHLLTEAMPLTLHPLLWQEVARLQRVPNRTSLLQRIKIATKYPWIKGINELLDGKNIF